MSLAGRPARARLRRPIGAGSVHALPGRERSEPPANLPTRKPRRWVAAEGERAATTPDLLHASAAVTVDEAALHHGLGFAFLAGSASGGLLSALGNTALAASSFAPSAYEESLFIDEWMRVCFDFPLLGKTAPIDHRRLRNLLTHPPSDPAHVEFRQQVLAELVQRPELARGLSLAYQRICVLFGLLDDEGVDSRLDLTQWRLDVLAAVRDAIDVLEGPFAAAGSGLVRLQRFAEHVQAGEAYKQLCGLLDFEAESARAELEVKLGADGRIRSLDIVSLRERRDSEFYVGPLHRFWRRMLAWLKGYRIGPNEVVERWLESVFTKIRVHIPTLFQLKGDLEFYLCALHFRALAESKGLAVCLASFVDAALSPAAKHVQALWNPLLLAEPRAPIPTDLTLATFACTCITTGPNSGGKTRFLQALAFTQLLGQCGAFVPARQAVLARASGMFVSLGERALADQKEGRLGMELMRIRELFEQARPGSLVILDELCSGTNPSEGEEIFRMLLELLHELRHEVHITTHFLSFAERLTQEAQSLGLCFLQVELDADQAPTYRFVPGVATTSLAQQTAQRLGVTREQVRRLIRAAASGGE